MMASTKKEDVKYSWTRLKLPEGLEAVVEGEDFTFNGISPNALVLGGLLLVRTKKKKKKKKKTK